MQNHDCLSPVFQYDDPIHDVVEPAMRVCPGGRLPIRNPGLNS